MGIDRRPDIVQDEIANINNDGYGREVAFNPQTGELEAVDSRSDVLNSTIVTDVAADGFAIGDKRPDIRQDEIIVDINNDDSDKEVAFNRQTEKLEVVDRRPDIVQDKIADINNDDSRREFSFNPQTGELKVLGERDDAPVSIIYETTFAMGDRRPDIVQDEIANINNDDYGREVAFNPQTGELEAVNGWNDAPNLIIITDVAKKGFANKPVVYAHEEEVVGLLKKNESVAKGIAYEWKGEDVYHIHIEPPKISVSGMPCMAFFCIVSNEDFSLPKEKLLRKIDVKSYFGNNEFNSKAIVCVFSLIDATLQKLAWAVSGNTITECELKYVPQKSELYSRSKGLLEVNVLETKSIAIVGLGSFGSNIAIELAKAGIGNFKLFDFDRIELSNIARHTCGVSDLGRYKTHAIRDAILQKNPFANVSTFEININDHEDILIAEIKDVDIILCLTDENQSRSRLNALSIEHRKTIIYGRAITRAEGGDVFRYTPDENKPCLACLIGNGLFNFKNEEISSQRQADRDLPAYTSAENKAAAVQVGLSSDILPICNMIVKLTLVELSKGLNGGLASLEEDLIADYYFWANRRENKYRNLPKMEYKANQLSILRWYGVKVKKNERCLACGIRDWDIVL
jgi:molybdopterin/thiamine biosynthesis adenylyltransferase